MESEVRDNVSITKKNVNIGGVHTIVEKIRRESETFVDNDELIRGFDIDPMFYMREEF